MCGRDANDAEGNKSINTEQLASITINDWDNSLLPNITIASCDSEPIGNKGQNMQTIDKLHAVNSSSNDESVQVTAVGYDNTYAKIAARRSPAIKPVFHLIIFSREANFSFVFGLSTGTIWN